ncbi:MAG: uroporphyrinogen-III C-methyltransferase, partial [Candidatus Omnitrophica bacterium]|nr:uroporphyrinogen-III C-methyltransferase [Candidatus Omnitrophota bacterium]
MSGKVCLVGAGPGDPGLLTVKALRLIQKADLIIYDYLVNPDHLDTAKPSAVKVCVGKGYRTRKLSQEKVNRRIIEAAKKGKLVVRLKGGDPYLFGRGGEEALFLARHGIPFEVVPGVTSATACAAYAGVPLTHRDHNSSVTFLTGHKAHDDHLDSVDWEKIVRIGGTLVIYMGFYNLAVIAERLIGAGMDQRAKVCVIQWGTLPRQKSCEGTLETIGSVVRQKKLGAPSIIIVGDVVGLKRKLEWYERLPLFGRRVVITRTKDKGSVLKARLNDLGAEVLELPLLEIRPVPHPAAFDRSLRDIARYSWVVFTSTYGVEAFFERLKNLKKDARILGRVRVASVGPETSLALERNGVRPDLEPKTFETAAFIGEFQRRSISLRGKRVLLYRTDIAPKNLEEDLRKRGAWVERITAYTTRLPSGISQNSREALEKGQADFLTFTSSSTVHHLVKILGRARVKKISK